MTEGKPDLNQLVKKIKHGTYISDEQIIITIVIAVLENCLYIKQDHMKLVQTVPAAQCHAT